MSFEPFTSQAALVLRNDIDTDQIIPARFLTVTSKLGLGEHLFADWRKEGVLEFDAGKQLLVSGENFGCGSSREHAPWALRDFGFRAIVARSFADIFTANALKNGVLPIAVDADMFANVLGHVEQGTRFGVDLAAQTLTVGVHVARFEVDAFSKALLLQGVDELEALQRAEDAIAAFEAARAL